MSGPKWLFFMIFCDLIDWKTLVIRQLKVFEVYQAIILFTDALHAISCILSAAAEHAWKKQCVEIHWKIILLDPR